MKVFDAPEMEVIMFSGCSDVIASSDPFCQKVCEGKCWTYSCDAYTPGCDFQGWN